ncbi:MAG: hypothetical protein DRQ55_07710 [Planctomycetota bacterium]|nr:MAG: hypothetical protein DRQ55_07710 [Planctomycetota bacterium]
MPRSTHRTLPLLATLATLGVLALALALFLDDDGKSPGDERSAPGPVSLPELGGRSELPAPVSAAPVPDRSPGARGDLAAEPAAPRGPRHIAVRVFDIDTDQPISAFQVTVLPAGSGPPRLRLDQASPQAFHLRGGIAALPQEPGRYDVVVQAPGYLPGELSDVVVPAANGRPFDVPLSRGAGIAGRVLGPDGLSRARVDVFLELTRLADPRDTPPMVTIAKSGADGGFSFSPLPDGEYAVTALELDNEVDRVAGVRVYGRSTEVVLQLAPRHQLSLKVEDPQGRPVQGAMVEVSGKGSMHSGSSSPSGLVVLENLRDGSYSVRVRAEGYQELHQELPLSGGMGQHLHWLRLTAGPDGEG